MAARRRDVLRLRQLAQKTQLGANPSAVGAYLAENAEGLLERAAELKRQAKASKQRTKRSELKKEWLLGRTKLSDDEAHAQNDLLRLFEEWAVRAERGDAAPCTAEEASSLARSLASAAAGADEERGRVTGEASTLAALAAAVRDGFADMAAWQRLTDGQGAHTFPGERPSDADVSHIAEDLAATRSAFEERISTLAREAASANADAIAHWPSAVPRTGAHAATPSTPGGDDPTLAGALVEVDAIVRAYPGAGKETVELAHDAATAAAESFAERAAALADEAVALGPPPAGWEEPRSHGRFYLLWSRAVADTHGRGRTHVLDRLALLHPEHSRSEVAAHVAYCERRQQLQSRRRTLAEDRTRAASELEAALKCALRESEEQEALDVAAASERLQRAARAQELGAELAAMRAAHIAAAAEEAARARIEGAAAEEARRQQAEVEAARREAERALLAEWRAEKEAAAQAMAEVEALRREDERMASRADAPRRLERVAFRQERRLDALAAKQEEAAARRAAADALEARLAKLRAQVGIDAPVDPKRVFQTTASHAADPMAIGPTMLRGAHAGYSEKQLRGDVRYRMSTALAEAGIAANKVDFVDNFRHLTNIMEKAKPFGPRDAGNMTSDQRAAYIARGTLKLG